MQWKRFHQISLLLDYVSLEGRRRLLLDRRTAAFFSLKSLKVMPVIKGTYSSDFLHLSAEFPSGFAWEEEEPPSWVSLLWSSLTSLIFLRCDGSFLRLPGWDLVCSGLFAPWEDWAALSARLGSGCVLSKAMQSQFSVPLHFSHSSLVRILYGRKKPN